MTEEVRKMLELIVWLTEHKAPLEEIRLVAQSVLDDAHA